MICQLRPAPCLTGSLPHTHHHHHHQALRLGFFVQTTAVRALSVCLCKKQGSAGQKVKSKEEAQWKRAGTVALAQTPSANPVAWDGISNPVWCVLLNIQPGVFAFAISIFEQESRVDEGERKRPSKTRHNPSGTLSPSSSSAPLPSSTLPRAPSSLSPGCWAARGPSPETRILLLVCQDRRF